MFDTALLGVSMYLLFERMYDLLKDNVIITCYVSGIGSLCGFRVSCLRQKGTNEFQRLGWAAGLAFYSHFHGNGANHCGLHLLARCRSQRIGNGANGEG